MIAHHHIMCSLSASILMQLSANGLGGVVLWNGWRGTATWRCMIFSLGTFEGSLIRMASPHSSPVVDLHQRLVQGSSLKPQNGEVYVLFGDQEVPCMHRHWWTSLWASRLTFIRTQYPYFFVFRWFFSSCKLVAELMPNPVQYLVSTWRKSLIRDSGTPRIPVLTFEVIIYHPQ